MASSFLSQNLNPLSAVGLISYFDSIPSDSFGNYSLMLIRIKNYEQVAALLSEDELEKYNSIIYRLIAHHCEIFQSYIKIFNYKKYYYCILSCKDMKKIETLAYQIHKALISRSYNSLFVDTKFVTIPLIPNLKFTEHLGLMADQIYYIEDDNIFTWIKESPRALNKINSDYQLIEELRQALNNKTACFAFQPIVARTTGRVAYYECLLRLNTADYRLVSAGKYILLAEKYGFVSIIDESVITMAIDELAHSKEVKLSINISNLGVQSKILLDRIEDLLTEYPVGPRLIIEITETAINTNFTQTLIFIETVKKYGCQIALDDFGTGYTSFSQLKDLFIDIIKIDGSYIRDISTNNRNKFLVETLIRMAEELGSKTVAEFVEDGAIAKLLIDMNIDYMQGHFFSPAINYRSWNKI